MPNNIRNYIDVTGNKQDVDNFRQYIESQINTDEFGNTSDFGGDVDFTEGWDGHMQFAFTTGWTPNTKFLSKLRLQFPTLTFTLFWVDQDNSPDYGHIDQNGISYSIEGDIENKIIAAKINKQYEHIQRGFTSLEAINNLLQNGSITRWEIDPTLQTWAVPDGSLPSFKIDPNNPIKIITFHGPNNIYYVKARYNPLTNTILPI